MKSWQFLGLSILVLFACLCAQELVYAERTKAEVLRKIEELRGVESENDEPTFLLEQAIIESEELKDAKRKAELRSKALEEVLRSFLRMYDRVSSGEGHRIDMRSKSFFTAEMYEQAWDILGLPGMKGTGPGFVKAEAETGINGLALAALGRLESGEGTSRIAREKNNLFGFGACSPNPYRNAWTFDSREAGALCVAQSLRDNYFSRGGSNTLVEANKRYAEDPRWAVKISRRMKEILLAVVDHDTVEALRRSLEE